MGSYYIAETPAELLARLGDDRAAIEEELDELNEDLLSYDEQIEEPLLRREAKRRTEALRAAVIAKQTALAARLAELPSSGWTWDRLEAAR